MQLNKVYTITQIVNKFGMSLGMIDNLVAIGRLERVVRAGVGCYKLI